MMITTHLWDKIYGAANEMYKSIKNKYNDKDFQLRVIIYEDETFNIQVIHIISCELHMIWQLTNSLLLKDMIMIEFYPHAKHEDTKANKLDIIECEQRMSEVNRW